MSSFVPSIRKKTILRVSIVATLAAFLIVFQNCGPARLGTSGQSAQTMSMSPSPPPAPPARVLQDRWESLPPGAPAGRLGATAVSSGDHVYIWGGEVSTGQLKTGLIYNLATKTWTAMADNSPLTGRHAHSAVLAGAKMYIFGGGIANGGSAPPTSDGASYDITTGEWSTVFNMPLSPRWGHAAVWTGSKIILWGGKSGPNAIDHYSDGVIFDPVTRAFQPMSNQNAPSARAHAAVVWTGTKMIVWGGYDSADSFADGAAYDPANNTWETLPTSSLGKRGWPMAAWSGSRFVVFGGLSQVDGAALPFGSSNTWSTISTGPLLSARGGAASCWTTRGLFIWSGIAPDWSTYFNDGAIYY